MAYQLTDFVTVGQAKTQTTRLAAEIAAASEIAGAGFKSAKVENGALKFYTSTDTTGTAAYSYDIPDGGYTVATDAEFNEMLDEVLGTTSGSTAGE